MELKLRNKILTDPHSVAPAILLIGKTGSGKSTLANMLFEEKKFVTSNSSDSETQICQSALLKLNEEEYNLVDTPGIFDTMIPDDETMEEIARSIVQCSHGIKAILYVIRWDRYTKEQQTITDVILRIIGQESYRHTIVVFTNCRKVQTKDRSKMEDDLSNLLKSFLDKIGNRWVILPDLDIFESSDPIVKRHLDDLKHYISLNPKPFTTDLFKKVKDAREKELEEIKERERENGKEEIEGKMNAGVNTAKKEFESEGGCFSLHSKVILADGKRIEMSQLKIGDKVCYGEKNGKLLFSEIYAIVHTDNQTMTQYQRINYLKADGTEGILRLTPKHHLFVSRGKTIFAKDVQAYVTELLLLDGKKLVPVIPHRVEKEWELGYMAPFTQSGRIIVDEILCSCYAVAPPYQEIINFAMAPFQLYSWIVPADCKKEIHPYLRYLKRVQWFLEQIDYFSTIIERS